MKPILAAAVLFLAAGAARASDEANRAGGGSPEELRAVLDLDTQQIQRVQQLFRDADNELQRMRDTARSRGNVVAVDQLIAWQDRLRDSVRNVCHPNQVSLYDGWLEKKRRLAEEYDKALFGIPCATELKLKIGISAETGDKIQKLNDQAVADIRKKIVELRSAGAQVGSIGDAVNELRKETLLKYPACFTSTEKRKWDDWWKTWMKVPGEKLSRTEFDHLDRIMKQLELADGVQSERVQSLTAAVLWHQEENAALRRGLGKELVMTLLQKRPEGEVWEAIYEYGTMLDIHSRRIKGLRDDLKAMLPTKQIAKLVNEGVLE